VITLVSCRSINSVAVGDLLFRQHMFAIYPRLLPSHIPNILKTVQILTVQERKYSKEVIRFKSQLKSSVKIAQFS